MRLVKTLFVLSTVILLVGCTKGGDKTSSSSSESSTTSSEELPWVSIGINNDTYRYTEAQANYLSNGENYSDTTPYNGNMSVSIPNPVEIYAESSTEKKKISIYKDEAKTEFIGEYYLGYADRLDFYNTLVGGTYYAVAEALNESDEVVASSDPTAFYHLVNENYAGPRNLYLEGVENVRDIGGWGKIKQGMLYRSGRFNEDKATEVTPSISQAGIFEATQILGIKTEIDLRRTANNEVGSLTDKSVLGDDVNYVSIPMAYGGNNILTFVGEIRGDETTYDNPAAIKEFFSVLAEPSNYPINFHCSIGKDRTGCMAYLIEALLGFDEETLMRDYMFTNFANAGMCKSTDITTRYGKTLSEYENGDTLAEKTYNYLNEVIGVTTNELDTIINLLKVE